MLWLKRLRIRVRSLVQRRKIESELGQEFDFHLAEQKAEYVSRGMSDAEAELAARRSFGNASVLAEQCRDQRHTRWLEDLAGDTKFAVRLLLRSPGFTWTAIATLALGVGVNLAFFSTAYGVLFRPLPYPEPERIVEIELGISGVGPTTAMREMARLVDYGGYLPKVDKTIQLGGEAVRLQTAAVTWNLARVLGIQPAIGRWFDAREESAGHHRAAVLSDRMWRERFGGDPNILGRQFLVDEEPYEVVGIMPPGFAFPARETEMWTPIHIDPSNQGYMWGTPNLRPIGRLTTAATLAAAQTELRSIVDRVRPMFPWRMPDAWGTSSTILLHSDSLVKDSRPKLLALAISSLLLLMIACGNVANLLLTRWILRDREFAVREALGAGRGRILRQVVTENIVLAAGGGAAGVSAALALVKVLPWLLGEVPRLSEIAIVPSAGVSAGAIVCITFAILVASAARRKIVRGQVASGSRISSTRRSSRISLALAGFQLSLTTALLIGAGLMGRTLWQLANVDTGIHAGQLLTGSVSAGASRCFSAERCGAFLQDLTTALSGVPGVRSINWSNGIPLTRQTSAMSVDIEGHPKEPGAPAFVLWHVAATPGYFGALGIPLRTGRSFSAVDRAGSLPVAIISESTAKRFWPNESPIGKTIRPVTEKIGRIVVGVVGDVAHHSLDGYPRWIDGVQYVPLEQALPVTRSTAQLSVFIEGSGIEAAAIQQFLRQRFPDSVLTGLSSLQAVREASVANRRSTAWLMSLLAALGLLLGIVGVYGTLSQRAAQRRPEMGIRIALGARPTEVAGVVLKEALVVGLVGSGVGVVTALGLSRFLRALLFGIAENDAVAYLVGPTVLIATALLAALIPALRASRLDPVKILRSE